MTKTIEERAKEYTLHCDTHPANRVGRMQGYIKGATDQRKMDVVKACCIYGDLLSAQGYNPIDVNREVIRMRQAMEE